MLDLVTLQSYSSCLILCTLDIPIWGHLEFQIAYYSRRERYTIYTLAMASNSARRPKKYKPPYPGVMFGDAQPISMDGHYGDPAQYGPDLGAVEHTPPVTSTAPAQTYTVATRYPANPVSGTARYDSIRAGDNVGGHGTTAAVGKNPPHADRLSARAGFVIPLYTVVFPVLVLLTYYYLPEWAKLSPNMYAGAGSVLGLGGQWNSCQAAIRQLPQYEYAGYEDGDTLNAIVRDIGSNMTAHITTLDRLDHDTSCLWADLEDASAAGNVTAWQQGLFIIEVGLKQPRQNLIQLVDNLRTAGGALQAIIQTADLEAKRALRDTHRLGDHGPESINRSASRLEEDKRAFRALGIYAREAEGVIHSIIPLCLARRDAERSFVEEIDDIQSLLPLGPGIDDAHTSTMLAEAQYHLYMAVKRLRDQSNITTSLHFDWTPVGATDHRVR